MSEVLAFESKVILKSVTFSEDWCGKFFFHSGDVNCRLHAPNQLRIVQGMAIMTLVGTEVSVMFPGFAVSRIGELLFRYPVKLGDTISIEIAVKEDTLRKKELLLVLKLKNGRTLLSTSVTLINESFLERMAR